LWKSLQARTWVVAQFEKHAPSAAKAAIDSRVLTARLKPRPFKTISN
jgi:hypothetical protein